MKRTAHILSSALLMSALFSPAIQAQSAGDQGKGTQARKQDGSCTSGGSQQCPTTRPQDGTGQQKGKSTASRGGRR